MTRKCTPRSSSASWAATRLGCWSRPAASTSRRNRCTAAGSRANDGGRILSAPTLPQATMACLEDHPHSALAELVEDQIVADEQAAALLLVDGGRLVGRELARLDQGARESQDPFGRIGGECLELRLVDQAELDELPGELTEVGEAVLRGRECVGRRRSTPVAAHARDDRLGFMDDGRRLRLGIVALVDGRHVEASGSDERSKRIGELGLYIGRAARRKCRAVHRCRQGRVAISASPRPTSRSGDARFDSSFPGTACLRCPRGAMLGDVAAR